MTTHPTMHESWVREGTVDQQKLEQFATSIAALSKGEATPLAILYNVLNTIAENLNASSTENSYSAECILKERAIELGFDDVDLFKRQILTLLRERIIDMEVHKITAFQRQIRAERSVSA